MIYSISRPPPAPSLFKEGIKGWLVIYSISLPDHPPAPSLFKEGIKGWSGPSGRGRHANGQLRFGNAQCYSISRLYKVHDQPPPAPSLNKEGAGGWSGREMLYIARFIVPKQSKCRVRPTHLIFSFPTSNSSVSFAHFSFPNGNNDN